jgi:N-acetylmuramoyl-L-alanine amidase
MPEVRHTVRPGDCLHSIAADHGLPWRKVWDHGPNRQLAQSREPNLLMPGDVVVVPEKTIRHEDRPSDAKHRFRKHREIVEIRVAVHGLGGPRKDEDYFLEVNGRKLEGSEGTTDGEGLAVARIPASAGSAVLVVGENEDEYELLPGHLDPVDTVTGIHGRLDNLGYDPGAHHTVYDGQSTLAAGDFLREVEDKNADAANPEDAALQQRLADEHGH